MSPLEASAREAAEQEGALRMLKALRPECANSLTNAFILGFLHGTIRGAQQAHETVRHILGAPEDAPQ